MTKRGFWSRTDQTAIQAPLLPSFMGFGGHVDLPLRAPFFFTSNIHIPAQTLFCFEELLIERLK